MEYMMMFTIQTMLMVALMSAFLSRKKVMMCILSLEFLLLTMFFMYIMYISSTGQPLPNSIVMLVMGACEASLVLSLLILMTRYKGNDMLTKISVKF